MATGNPYVCVVNINELIVNNNNTVTITIIHLSLKNTMFFFRELRRIVGRYVQSGPFKQENQLRESVVDKLYSY